MVLQGCIWFSSFFLSFFYSLRDGATWMLLAVVQKPQSSTSTQTSLFHNHPILNFPTAHKPQLSTSTQTSVFCNKKPNLLPISTTQNQTTTVQTPTLHHHHTNLRPLQYSTHPLRPPTAQTPTLHLAHQFPSVGHLASCRSQFDLFVLGNFRDLTRPKAN